MNLAERYRLAPGVAIRAESFGGLVYRHDNRRLYCLPSREIVDLVGELDGARPLDAVLDEFVEEHALPVDARRTLTKAVAQLADLGVLITVPG